ncbi:MAG TPA: hypothetical protein VFP46_01450 [Candidatus Paceibacterota bacterium]|nr:hypothetical protein [Candidatus Paceibacterota bacterium]
MRVNFSSSSFVAGIIVGVLLAGASFAASTSDLTYFSRFSPDAPAKALAEPSRGILVADQAAGSAVSVNSVDAAAGVWVAVREMRGRELGNVLGAVRIGGPRENLLIPLLRSTEPGRTYAVMLYRDDAELPFDPSRMSVYVDFDSGSRVVAYFNTTN